MHYVYKCSIFKIKREILFSSVLHTEISKLLEACYHNIFYCCGHTRSVNAILTFDEVSAWEFSCGSKEDRLNI